MEKKWRRWAPMPLRLMIGFAFIYHGAPKLFTASGHDAFVGLLQGFGVPVAGLAAWLVAILEVAGGVALIVGAFTAIVSGLLIIEMVVALFAVHLPHGFNFINITGMTESGPQFGMPGFEVNLLYIAGLLTLVLGGAGKLSVDEGLGRSSVKRHQRSPSRDERSKRAPGEKVPVG
ncbi:MAG: DoxX family protein [Gemmatimonadales bacterium]|jgi:putative oxidoreductase